MGSLSSPNLIKDVYTKLVFRKSDGLFYRDDGTDDGGETPLCGNGVIDAAEDCDGACGGSAVEDA